MGITTPYAAAKLASQAFAEVGLPPVRPQMMYNYTTARLRDGKAPFIDGRVVEVDGELKFDVNLQDLQRWIDARVRKAGKVPADKDQLEFDLSEAN